MDTISKMKTELVSWEIKDLEAEIEVRLIARSGRRISLTQEGESFLLDARRLLSECVQAVQRLNRGESGQLNIGYLANIYHDLLPATLGAFRKTYPRTALNLFDMTPAEQYRAIEAREIDLGFVCFRAASTGKGLQWACVGHDRVMVAVRAGNPLAKKPKIDLKDLEPKGTVLTCNDHGSEFRSGTEEAFFGPDWTLPDCSWVVSLC